MALLDVYLMPFLLAKRLLGGLWPTRFNAGAHYGVAAVSAFAFLYVYVASTHIIHFLDASISYADRSVAIVEFVVIFSFNYYLIVFRSTGCSFESRFNSYATWHKAGLFLASGSLSILAVAFFFSLHF